MDIAAHGLSEILDRVSDAVIAVDPHWQIAFANSTAARLTAKTPDDLIGGILWAEFEGLRGTEFESRARQAVASEKKLQWVEYFDAYGLWGDVSIYPTRDGLTIYVQDCSERRAAGDAMRLRSAMLAAVGEAVIATDVNGIVLFWNEAAVQLYGWTAEEAVGRSVVDLTPSSVSRTEAAKIMTVLAAGDRWQGAFEVQRKDGTSFIAHVTDAPVLGEDGNLIGIVGVSYNRDRASHAAT